MTEVTCVWEAAATLGEGPVWVPRDASVYWVDIKGNAVHRYEPATGGKRIYELDRQVCSVTPRAQGGMVAATRHGFAYLDLETGAFEPIVEVEIDMPGNRFNDAKADFKGRLWAGTMDDTERTTGAGTLYRLDPGGSCAAMDRGYGVTNGPAFQDDGTMFHTDSHARTIYAFDLDEEGGISNKRRHIKFTEEDGFPDGMTVDSEGYLWVAHYSKGRVSRFAPDGRVDGVVEVPAKQTTSVVFGGADLDRLYITSATQNMDDEARRGDPLAGGFFEVRVGITGRPTAEFAG
ncbi:MAG: SMP-30/gluconolactonase/LRE family protein [Rhodospirillales bacterium]|nr:SMP-30/gluconolactonase/LRE family protein [Rhodospirillales bacterium]